MKSELIKEEWKDVPGYENRYRLSNFGRALSLNYNHTGKTKMLKPHIDNCGYQQYGFQTGNKTKYYRINRLVYETFIGSIPNGMQVNHINEIKTDNSVWNLNLMTPKENTNYGKCVKRRSEKRKKPVLQYSIDGSFIKEWESATDAEASGFNNSNIKAVCSGRRKTHKGFIWKNKL